MYYRKIPYNKHQKYLKYFESEVNETIRHFKIVRKRAGIDTSKHIKQLKEIKRSWLWCWHGHGLKAVNITNLIKTLFFLGLSFSFYLEKI